MKQRPYVWPFAAGLQTTGLEDGLPLPAFKEFQNVRVDRGAAKRRKGIVRVDRATNGSTVYTSKCFDLNGTDQYAEIPKDTRVHDMKRAWTLGALCRPDSLAAQCPILDVAHASDYGVVLYVTTGGAVVAKVQDSAATVTTLTSATTYSAGTELAIQLVRAETALTLYVNGASEATGSIADLDGKTPGGNLYIGRDNAGNYFNGPIDYVRLLSFAWTDVAYGRIRLPDSRMRYVLMDYAVQESVNGTSRVDDRSRFENHATHYNTPTEIDALCVQDLPVTCIASWLDSDAKERLLFGAGGSLYFHELVR
jgi:hypothetical protein